MIKVYQSLFGQDDGDCFSACIASLLHLKLSDVPNFNKEYEGGFMTYAIAWLRSKGWSMICIRASNINGPAVMLGTVGMYAIAGYPSSRNLGGKHAVIVQVYSDSPNNLKIVHDPAEGSPAYRPVVEVTGPHYLFILAPIASKPYVTWLEKLKDRKAEEEYNGDPLLRADIKPDRRDFEWKASGTPKFGREKNEIRNSSRRPKNYS